MLDFIGTILIFFGLFGIAGSFIIYIINSISITLDDGQLLPWHPFPIFIMGVLFLLIGVIFLIPTWLYERSKEKSKIVDGDNNE